MPKPIPDPCRRRIAALRKQFDAAGIDALLVSYAPDQCYLTGAMIEDSAVLIAARQVVIITDSRFDEQVRQQAPWAEKLLRTDSLADAAAKLAADLKAIRSLGVDEHMLLGQYRSLSRKIHKFRLKPTSGLVSAGRIVKDDAEVAIIQKAVRVAEAGFLATRKLLKPAMREREAVAELEYQMRLAGASGPSFESIVAVGPRGSLPHARAGETRLNGSQTVLIDWGARLGGYCSDLTRVICLGRVPPKIREIHSIVAEAQLAGIAAIRPGAKCKDVDNAARQIIEEAGYGPRFGHGLGHGLGLDIHEAPRLSMRSDETLAAGMVVTAEPGIYLPGVGGVRIEDDVLVTPTGHRVLSRLGRGMEE